MTMKKSLFFLLFPLLMSGCSISKTPSGPIFSSYPNSDEEELEFYEGSGDTISENGTKYVIDFDNVNYNTHSFSTPEEINDIIKSDEGLINAINHEFTYASRNGLLLDWNGKNKGYIDVNLNISIRYVKIFASPFYSKRYDYDLGKDVLVCTDSAININNKKYVKLDTTQDKEQIAPILSVATFDLESRQSRFKINTGVYSSFIYKIELFSE